MFYKVPFHQIVRQGDITEGLISFGAIQAVPQLPNNQ